jgi:hypothetical protein
MSRDQPVAISGRWRRMRLSECIRPAIRCDLGHVAVEPDGLHDDTNGRGQMIPKFLINLRAMSQPGG